MQAKIAEDIDNAMLRIDQITLSQLEGIGPQQSKSGLKKKVCCASMAGSCSRPRSQVRQRQPPTPSSAKTSSLKAISLFSTPFNKGGKEKRTGTGLWDRISHKVSSTAQITHPTNYTVVNVQQTVEKVADPG